MTYEKDGEGSNTETTTVNTTLNHRFWTEDGWKSAGTLEAGDKLTLADGNTATVTNIAYEDTHATVYNFEVEDFHTYYVGTESVLVHNNGGNCMKTASALAQGGSKTATPLSLQQALEELDGSGLRPGQTELHISQLNSVLGDIQKSYNPTKAYSSVYSDGINRYLVEGHHTTVAFRMLGKDNAINMNTVTKDLPSATNVYWTKKWYQFWRKTIKIVED